MTTEETADFNQQPSVAALQRFDGVGHLRCQHGTTWDCSFSIARLLNGRLRVDVAPENDPSSGWDNIRQCRPFSIEGTDLQGNQISATDIRLTPARICFRHDLFQEALIGYARSAIRRSDKEPDSGSVTIKCELTNVRLTSIVFPATMRVGGFVLEIGSLDWEGHQEIGEHGNAYRHAIPSAYLCIRDIPAVEQDSALECIDDVARLLSIAHRGHAFLVARHKYDLQGQWLDNHFDEPVFTARGWLRPLIPDESLGDFLTAAYPQLIGRYRSLELVHVIDHYLQALTLHSVWPLSLGIFTAMETLKAAFFRQTADAEFEFWIVRSEDFENNSGMFDELISVLGRHFSRFRGLRSNEKQSLKEQLKGLNRRSYKTQLRRMLGQLGVSCQKDEIQSFINIRNRIIHQGTPVPSDVSEYEDRTSLAWKQVQAAAGLFERALLAVLGYEGPSELFGQEA